MGFPGSPAGKESACSVEDPGSIPGSERSPGEGIGYLLQYSWASLVAQSVNNLPAIARDLGSIPGVGRSPGGAHGNQLQYSCLESPHGQRNLVGAVHGVTKSQTWLATKHTANWCLDRILKSRDIPLPTKVCLVKASSYVWMCELDHKEGWVLKNWGFGTVVLEKTLECPLDIKEIKPVNLKWNQPWIFIERVDAETKTPILWPPDAKNWLIGKAPDAGKDWRWEKGMTENEMVGWHHWLNGHEFGQTPGDSGGQESLACCSLWGHKESGTTEWLNSNSLITHAWVVGSFASSLAVIFPGPLFGSPTPSHLDKWHFIFSSINSVTSFFCLLSLPTHPIK